MRGNEMSDDATKDLEIALRLLLGKQMKEAVLSGDTAEATKLAVKLEEVEDLAAADAPRKAPQRSAARSEATQPVKSKDASGSWIN